MRKNHKAIVVILLFHILSPIGLKAYGQNSSSTNRAFFPQSQGSASGHEYVDLGLSVLWATCNVGATKPEEYGIFSPWGEVNDVNSDVQWRNNWRVPTRDEFRELCSNCTLKWITINGHNGYLFTADNGNSIFLPAAGNREGDLYYWDENRYGYYWSSDVYEQKREDAWGLYFHRGIADVTHGIQNRKFCVRLVICR